MKKEIGSIFPLSNNILSEAENASLNLNDDRAYYSLCREALYEVAILLGKQNPDGTVLIPAFTCHTVISPFEEAGWHCEYYSIQKNLRIDIPGVLNAVEKFHPSLLVVHPYFGMDLNETEMAALRSIREMGVEIVIDLTQCLFSTKDYYSIASFIVASYRKWMPIPDGGYLISTKKGVKISQPEKEFCDFVERQKDAMYLRYLYFENGEQRTKAISIRLNKEAVRLAGQNITTKRMSKLSYYILENEDKELNQRQRLANYKYLHLNIPDRGKVTKMCGSLEEVTTAPLYFTIYVDDRASLQSKLAKESVYAPIIWPVEDDRVLIDDGIKYIYGHLLAIPCDQRYNEGDMQRIVETINQY